jgi:hypothetical protein
MILKISWVLESSSIRIEKPWKAFEHSKGRNTKQKFSSLRKPLLRFNGNSEE